MWLQFSAGAIVARALAVFGRGLPVFAALALAATAAVFAAGEMSSAARPRVLWDRAFIAFWVMVVLAHLGAVTHAALRGAAGNPVRIGTAVAAGCRRVLPVAAVVLLCTGTVLAGLTALVAPGVAAVASLGVALPAAMEERAGPFRAFARSLELTRGTRWVMLAALASLATAAGLATVVPWVAIAFLSGTASTNVLVFASMFVAAFFLPLPLIGSAVAYREFRRAREGYPEAELVKVFE